MELKQIEADVVFVAEHVDGTNLTITTFPFWECDLSRERLAAEAARIGLTETERAGSGFTRVTVFDYR